MRLAGGPREEPGWLYAVAGAVMLGGPVWHYLYVNHYPFNRPEAIALPVAGALLGTVIAMLVSRLGGLLGSVGFGVLLFVSLDLQFSLERLTYTIVIVAACIGLALVLRQRRAALTAIMLGVFYLASLPRVAVLPTPSSTPVTPGSPAAPVIVHLILDEQWGIGALRAEGDTTTAAFLRDFYASRGFEVYEAAYSRFRETRESIATALSLGQPVQFNEPIQAPAFQESLRSAPYFEVLRDLGYAIRVYQSTYLDYCNIAGLTLASCRTESGNSIANIGHLHGAWTERAALAARYLLTQTSRLYNRIRPVPAGLRASIAGAGLSTIEHAQVEIAGSPPGGFAFFVHALLPHRPTEVDAECRAVGDADWREGYFYPRERSDSSWRAALAHLGAQARCAHAAVAKLLATLDSTVGRDRSIVIVHGDHGSRLFQREPDSRDLFRLSGRELNAMYATLLAVRRPGVSGGVYREPVPVQDFLWALAANRFQGQVQQDWQHFVRGDSTGSDSLRVLSAGDMLWAGTLPGVPVRTADSSPVRH